MNMRLILAHGLVFHVKCPHNSWSVLGSARHQSFAVDPIEQRLRTSGAGDSAIDLPYVESFTHRLGTRVVRLQGNCTVVKEEIRNIIRRLNQEVAK